MFYCEKCKKKYRYPESLMVSNGNCEICGTHAECFDVPSSHLPKSFPDVIDPTTGESPADTVLDVIKDIPQQKQVQYDTQTQLLELRVAANKLGLYDASDFIWNKLHY